MTLGSNTAALVDVLANDVDPDGDSLSVTIDVPPANGTATLEAGGVRYTPEVNFSGTDSFRYTVSDGRGGSDTATVSLTVEPSPVEILAISPSLIENDITIQITIILTGFDLEVHTVTSLSFVRGDAVTEIPPDPMTVGSRLPVTVPRLLLSPGRYDVSIEVTDGHTTAAHVLVDGLTVLAEGMVIDETPPTVTVDQAAGQVDPTATSPVEFTTEFSEAVFGFTSADVDLSGSTTDGILVAAVTGGPAIYTVSVEVSGATVDGTVVAAIPAGVAEDAFGNGNEVSTSTDNAITFEAPEEIDPLTISVPADIVVPNDLGAAGAIVNYPLPTASGGQPPVTVRCAPASGSFFALGDTQVECTATDAAEAVDRHRSRAAIVAGSFTVTVDDTERPAIASKPDITTGTTGSSALVTFELPDATDNSDEAPTVACSPGPGSSFPLGETTVTCTATDGAGNSASSSFSVTVASEAQVPPAGTTPTVPAPPDSRLPETGGSSDVPPAGTTPTVPASPGPRLPGTGGSSGVPLQVAVLLLLTGVALVVGAHVRQRAASR